MQKPPASGPQPDSRLKPCPFCGSPAYTIYQGIYHAYPKAAQRDEPCICTVGCTRCKMFFYGQEGEERTIIGLWNRRVGE